MCRAKKGGERSHMGKTRFFTASNFAEEIVQCVTGTHFAQKPAFFVSKHEALARRRLTKLSHFGRFSRNLRAPSYCEIRNRADFHRPTTKKLTTIHPACLENKNMPDLSSYKVGVVLSVQDCGASKGKSLRACQVNVGDEANPITVVTAASNVRQGSRQVQ